VWRKKYQRRKFHEDRGDASGGLSLSYYETSSVSNTFQMNTPGAINWFLTCRHEKYVDKIFDYNKCRFIFTAGRAGTWSKRF